MIEYEAVHLRVAPQAVPQLRAAFEKAIEMLEPAIRDLGVHGRIDGVWMGDPKSQEVVDLYNGRVMDADDGPYRALELYLAELVRIVEQLAAVEQDYRHTEQANAELFAGGAV